MDKIRPDATAEFSYGIDGRDPHHYILYKCPTCNRRISENDIACTECGTFFDWSKRATIRTILKVVWE